MWKTLWPCLSSAMINFFFSLLKSASLFFSSSFFGNGSFRISSVDAGPPCLPPLRKSFPPEGQSLPRVASKN
ncbi:hypothetical protein DFJ73DRAFT_810612 [Zopfochytrium polystomum]|nr:hypothetical protein DFJ73DRAFT_810612 [Zopfochytrium polystomum]